MKREIYLAGGCFWGLQKYIDSEVNGVISTECGYANGRGEKSPMRRCVPRPRDSARR